MKKFSFFAVACAIAMTASVMTSCNSKPAAPEIPEGTAIGNIAYFTADDGTINFIKTNEDGTKEAHATEYKELKQEDGFIVAQNADGNLNILSLEGQSFAICSSYEVGTLAPVAADEQPAKIVLTKLDFNGNHLAYLIESHASVAMVSGIKEAVIPLSNGYTIFKKKDGWGFGKSDAEDGILEDLKAVNAVSTKAGKFYFWCQSKDFTGLVNEKGDGVKPMNANAFKALKKKGKTLWEKDGSVGILVKSI